MNHKRTAAALATAGCIALFAVVPAFAGPRAESPSGPDAERAGRPGASDMTTVSFCVYDTSLEFLRMERLPWPVDEARDMPVPGLHVIDGGEMWLTAAVGHPIGKGVCRNLPERVLTDEPLPPTDEGAGPDPSDPTN